MIAAWNRSERPATMPSGTPTRSDRPTAASIRASVSMLASQSPSSANEAKARATITAARTPPKRQHHERADGGRAEPAEPEDALVEPGDQVVDERREAVEDPEERGSRSSAERWSSSQDWNASSLRRERRSRRASRGQG